MNITKCNREFGRFIKRGRLERGLYQEDIAREAGISQVYYSLMENGKRNVDLSLALKLCSILGLDITTFIETQTNKKNRP